jgi:hypothetical protein
VSNTSNDANGEVVTFTVECTSTDGGTTFDSGATDYAYDLRKYDTASVQTVRATIAPYGIVTQTVGNGTGESLNGEIWIYPGGSSFPLIRCDMIYTHTGGYSASARSASQRSSAATIDAVRVYPLSGNITSGDFHLYGIADGA